MTRDMQNQDDAAPPGAMPHTPQQSVTGDQPTRDYRCSMPDMPEPAFTRPMHPDRLSALLVHANKWVNGTILHYCFLGDNVPDAQKQVVIDAFAQWKSIGLGLEFEKVETPSEAEVRIGFVQGDGSWSYIGTTVLQIPTGSRTMNFGWSLTGPDGMDTALHEIGHTLGLPHEHQNPQAGIVWDEQAVYDALAQPPNSWSKEQTYHNIIRKLPKNSVRGSNWDPNSVMHYPFEPGLVLKPDGYRESGIRPAGGLSTFDRQWAQQFYPPITQAQMAKLSPGVSVVLPAESGAQVDLRINPSATRKYSIQTFGTSDCVIALFRDINGKPVYMTADDDSGDDRNARIDVKLHAAEAYTARVRVKYAAADVPPAIMMW